MIDPASLVFFSAFALRVEFLHHMLQGIFDGCGIKVQRASFTERASPATVCAELAGGSLDEEGI